MTHKRSMDLSGLEVDSAAIRKDMADYFRKSRKTKSNGESPADTEPEPPMSASMKQRIRAVIERLDDDASIDVAIHRLVLLKKLDQSLEKIKHGKYVDHDELFDRLLNK